MRIHGLHNVFRQYLLGCFIASIHITLFFYFYYQLEQPNIFSTAGMKKNIIKKKSYYSDNNVACLNLFLQMYLLSIYLVDPDTIRDYIKIIESPKCYIFPLSFGGAR